MDEDQGKQGMLVETTDCLEAVGVFRGWKNFLFAIVALCLILLQLSFWSVDIGYIKAEASVDRGAENPADAEKAEMSPTHQEADAEPNQPTEEAAESTGKASSLFDVTFDRLSWVIRFANGVLILAAMLYWLTVLFSLKVSLIGRLGGINHISRAFFLSLVMLVLLLPWQLVLGSVVLGATYTPAELAQWYQAKGDGLFGIILYYLRFCGYWVLVLLLLLFSQARSSRWAKAILRRLEVI
jgi:hypothetical protein